MKARVREPEEKYGTNAIDLAVRAAVAKELNRKRKLGRPMVFGNVGKIIIMVGDTVVEETASGDGSQSGR